METILATAFGRQVDIQRGETDELSDSARLFLKDSEDGDFLYILMLLSKWLKQ